MASAVRWMRLSSTGPIGNPGSAMTAVTTGVSWSDSAMAARTAVGSLSASVCPSSIARTNAAAVFGCCRIHFWVATYPSMGKFTVAPWSRSASSCSP